jgi:hypothetical protein
MGVFGVNAYRVNSAVNTDVRNTCGNEERPTSSRLNLQIIAILRWAANLLLVALRAPRVCGLDVSSVINGGIRVPDAGEHRVNRAGICPREIQRNVRNATDANQQLAYVVNLVGPMFREFCRRGSRDIGYVARSEKISRICTGMRSACSGRS